jgi:UPF0755 protein
MEFFRTHFSAESLRPYCAYWRVCAIGLLVLLGAGYYYLFSSPPNISPQIVTITYGTSTKSVADSLYVAGVIRHPLVFRALLRLSPVGSVVQTGVYKFDAPEDLFTVARRLATGAYGLPPVRITFIEGATTREMAAQIALALPYISSQDFLARAREQEGYLFPDTYLFQPFETTSSIVSTMRANFEEKVAPLLGDISASGHSLAEIVTMASLVEKEGRTTETRRMIAGILWNRLARHMPLQVDAVFGYINDRPTYSPSYADLKIDSPYNTYTHTGLPPGPINNPGLDALEDVLHPAKTNYLYYLTDKNGVMHYATTYAGHEANQRKYLP